jgi:hypothetical protein
VQNLAAEDAEEVLAAFRLVTFMVTSCAVLLEEAYRLAVTHQRTVYDAMYLALSLRENCRWVTADEGIVNALGGDISPDYLGGQLAATHNRRLTNAAGDGRQCLLVPRARFRPWLRPGVRHQQNREENVLQQWT